MVVISDKLMNLLKLKTKMTPKTSRFDVFISYSRDDDAFVRRLYDVLNERERSAWVDWKGIPPTADWMAEVFAAIESADNFIFVLSKASLDSEVCSREVEHAVKCRKRLVPLVWREIDDAKVPDELRRLNWIICRNDNDFPHASASLLEALTVNLEWVREHTRLLVRAVDWRDGGADASLLLRGSDLKDAEQWLAQGVDEEPKPTELHREYVLASRTQETRRGRRTLSVVAAGLVLAVGLAVVAFVQRQEAKKQATIAEERRLDADKQRKQAEQRRIEAERQNVAALTNESKASLSLGLELDALLASVKAGKELQHESSLLDGSKAVFRTLVALRRAITEGHERNRIPTGHFRGVTQIAFSPDDQSLYSAGGGGDIKRWSLDGNMLFEFKTEHSGEGDGCTSIQNFAVSPDGKVLATLGNEGAFALWTADGKRIGGFDSEIHGPGDGMCSGIVDSKINFSSKTVTIREAEQESVWSFSGTVSHRTTMPAALDGETRNERVTNNDGTLWADSNGEKVSVLRREGPLVLLLNHQRTAAFSNHSNQLATVSSDVDDSIVHIWDLNVPTPAPSTLNADRPNAGAKKKLKLGSRTVDLNPVEAFDQFQGVLSPDGQFAAAVTGYSGQQLQLWKITSGISGSSPIAEFDADQIASADFAEALQSLSYSPDSQLLASGGSDGTVKLWDMNGKLVRKIVAHSQGTNVRFSPDGRLLLTWGDSRDGEVAVKLWTVDGELLDSLSTERVKDAWFTVDSKWILATLESQDRKKVWSLDLDQLLHNGCDALHLYLANPAMIEDAKVCS